MTLFSFWHFLALLGRESAMAMMHFIKISADINEPKNVSMDGIFDKL